ncbi:MAG TPA: class I SAM-dependent methyltransferase [candidate division Zixibacteria bacterium]|nr:class I SAM-dependent methyltransferase [candidate division Zixibacteria bacterium]
MTQLSDEQLIAFDREYVNERRWSPIKKCIECDFPDGRFTFLDIGGGNGIFADRVLANYPNAKGFVLDSSRLLLERNKPDYRKHLILDNALQLEHFVQKKVDIVFCNWLLHHLVAQSSYSGSRENITHVLSSMSKVLNDRGRISIYENIYNGSLIDNAPSWIVYRLTSAKSIARWIKKRGANTAGVGVCFLSLKQWCYTLRQLGLEIIDYTNDDIWKIPWTWRIFLHIGHIRCGHFWLKRQDLYSCFRDWS